MDNPIKVGISSCLLGNKVRYDGQHKLNRYLRDQLGNYVEWLPVCPEVECGLPTPRESMHLEGSMDEPHLVTTKTEIDHTDKMQSWIKQKIADLATEDLCGFVFKTKSPSSGMRGITVFKGKGKPLGTGPGLFASAFMKAFPHIPVEDEGRLNDNGLRENFIEHLFVMHRWRNFMQSGKGYKDFIDFHTRHKYILMAHSNKHLKLMGKLVAEGKRKKPEILMHEYMLLLMEAMKLKATVNKNTNVLQHLMGYFKEHLTSDEKAELSGVIKEYHQELVPLIVPIVLIQHYVRKYDQEYLRDQYYLFPHPRELKLRNHV